MISDTLFEAVNEIDRYLNDPLYAGMYSGDLRERIVSVRDQMHALRAELDLPPDAQFTDGFELPPKGTIIAPLSMIEAMVTRKKMTLHERQQEEFNRRMTEAQNQEEVPGTMAIDETNLVINKRTGAFGLQFKVSFKPESGE